MLNCGLTDLRLVKPRDGWPNPKAVANASGADSVIEAARLFDSAGAAIADLERVYATTARHRGMIKRVVTPRAPRRRCASASARGRPVGVLFGPERMGLVNEHVALADAVISVPLEPRLRLPQPRASGAAAGL
jgi:rRNA methylase